MLNVKVALFLTFLLAIGFGLWRFVLSTEARRIVDARFGLVILLPALGLLTPNIWIYYGAVAAAMLLLPRTRAEAVGLFILIALTLPLSSTTLTAGTVYVIKVDPMRIASVALIFAVRFPGQSPAGASSRGISFDILFLLFFLLVLAIGLRAGEQVSFTHILRTILENLLPFGIPFFLMTRSFHRQPDQRQLVAFFVMAGLLLSVVATFEMTRHWPLYQTIDTHLSTGNGLSKTMAVRGGLLRSPGPFQESTTFGVLLAMTTIATAALRSIFRSPATYYGAIMIGISGTFATLARNGWVGLGIGLVLLGLYKGKVGKTTLFAIAVAVVLSIFNVAAPQSGTFGALVGKSGHAEQTGDYRERLLAVSIPVFKESPWIGTPIRKLNERLKTELRSRKLDVDYVNSYLYFAMASGSIGLFVFIIFVIAPFPKLLKLRRSVSRRNTDLEVAAAAFSCLGALSVMVFFTSFYERVPFFLVLIFGFARNVFLAKRSDEALPTRKPGLLSGQASQPAPVAGA